MTERLYYTSQYLDNAQAVVISAAESEKGILLLLDRTVFFPCGGGQPSDTGRIVICGESDNVLDVTDVYEENGNIYHLCTSKNGDAHSVYIPPVNTKVMLYPDVYPRRVDFMRQHTAEHMISYSMKKLYGAVNVGFHMNSEFSTCDFDIPLTYEQLIECEKDVNEAVMKNKRVYDRTYSEEETDSMELRKRTEKLHGSMRVVFVEDNDSCTCCGLHVENTGEIGAVKIISSERLRGGTRVYFLCGTRALEDYRAKSEIISSLSGKLSAKQNDILAAVEGMEKKLADMKRELSEKSRALALSLEKDSEEINGILFCASDILGAAEAELIAKMPAKGNCAGFGRAVFYKASEDRIGYIFAKGGNPQIDCKALCMKANEAFGGKGGGKSDFARATALYDGSFDDGVKRFKELL